MKIKIGTLVLAAFVAAPSCQTWIGASKASAATERATERAQAAGSFDAVASLRECYVSSGPYKGAFVRAPRGYLNWYFANLGLYGFARARPAAVKAYLNVYIRSLNADGTISDVDFSYERGGFSAPSRHNPLADSHDSYAATLLSLAALYLRVTDDQAWASANMSALKRIGQKNLLDQPKASGLITNFQGGTFGYAEDNAECYKGLSDFAWMLAALRQPEAASYRAAAQGVAQGIRGLFDNNAHAYHVVDDGSDVGNKFYADKVTQPFAQCFDVPQGDAATTRRMYDAAWNFLNEGAPNWPRCIADPQNIVGDPSNFPWMLLGYVAAKRGDRARATTQMQAVRALATRDRGKVTINELGWYQRTADWLAGIRY